MHGNSCPGARTLFLLQPPAREAYQQCSTVWPGVVQHRGKTKCTRSKHTVCCIAGSTHTPVASRPHCTTLPPPLSPTQQNNHSAIATSGGLLAPPANASSLNSTSPSSNDSTPAPLHNTSSGAPQQNSSWAEHNHCSCSDDELEETEQYCFNRRLVVLIFEAYNAVHSHCELPEMCDFSMDRCAWINSAIQDSSLAESIRSTVFC